MYMLCLILTMPLFCNYIVLLLIAMAMLQRRVHVLSFAWSNSGYPCF